MAGIQKIRQNYINENGIVSRAPITWTYVNTTIDEESYIIKEALVPLGLLDAEGELSAIQQFDLQAVMKCFFAQGFFLTGEHWTSLQRMLKAHGLSQLELEDDGCYDQPLDSKNKKALKPTARAWKLNGARRLREYDRVYEEARFKQMKESMDEIAAEFATRDGADIEAKVSKAIDARETTRAEHSGNTIISFFEEQ